MTQRVAVVTGASRGIGHHIAQALEQDGYAVERGSRAVAEVVRKQAEAGVDLINDGELSKPSYATYIKDRLNGFGGTAIPF